MTVGRAIVQTLREMNCRAVAIAVSKVHSQQLVELPDDLRQVKAIVGEAKRKSSRAIKTDHPGSVWAAGGTYKPVENEQHWRRALDYILYEQGADAWTWAEFDAFDEGRFGRKRENDSKRRFAVR